MEGETITLNKIESLFRKELLKSPYAGYVIQQIRQKYARRREDLITEQARIAFRKKFNANLDVILKAIPQDFKCEYYIHSGIRVYKWCDHEFLAVKDEIDENYPLSIKTIFKEL